MNRRVVGLLLVVLTAGALIGVARDLPAEAARQARGASLPVTPAAEVPVCSGPETLTVPDGATPVTVPGTVAVAGVAALPSVLPQQVFADDAQARSARRAPAAPAASLDQLAARPDTTAAGTGGATASGPAVRVLQSTVGQPGAWRLDVRHVADVPVVAAAQWTLATSGDLRGLATTTCAPAATDSWLLGGTTLAGTRLRLLLANPGVSPSVVDVTLLGPQGAVQVPAGTGVTVPAGGQKALYLDALAADLPALAVHVVARTGRVASTLHVSVLRGVVPGGTDDVPAAAAPARRQVIPGLAVMVPAAGAQSGDLPSRPTAPGAVAVRVADPGGTEAVVRVHLLGPVGEVNLPTGGVATVPARAVVDIPVTGVHDGVYAAVVEADTPVVAAALVGRAVPGSAAAGTPASAGSVPPAELAWTAAARPLQATTAIAVPVPGALVTPGPGGHPVAAPAVTARLALAPLSGAGGRVALAEVAADGTVGAARTVDVPAGHSVTVPLTAGSAGVLLRADPGRGDVAAAVVLTATDSSGGLVSVEAVRPGSRNSGDAPVVVQDLRIGLATVGPRSR